MNQTIIGALEVMRRKAAQDAKNGGVFKARAYAKVITAIMEREAEIKTMDDVASIPGIGEGIKEKIREVLDTGLLAAAEDIKNDGAVSATDELLHVYGIGPAKANELVAAGIKSVAMLRAAVAKKTVALNDKQTIGMKYYEDLLLRIPRAEVADHERLLKKAFGGFECSVVGSYRRGAADGGDVDLLVKTEKPEPKIIQALRDSGYIIETLAEGAKKFMGIARLREGLPARRLDILFTPEKEYGFALLYFTGSDKFNVDMRKHALTRGWSLNEHTLSYVGKDGKDGEEQAQAQAPNKLPKLNTEEEIFAFLEVPWTPPTERSVYPKTLFPSVYRKIS